MPTDAIGPHMLDEVAADILGRIFADLSAEGVNLIREYVAAENKAG